MALPLLWYIVVWLLHDTDLVLADISKLVMLPNSISTNCSSKEVCQFSRRCIKCNHLQDTKGFDYEQIDESSPTPMSRDQTYELTEFIHSHHRIKDRGTHSQFQLNLSSL
ncbi:uncharacterized protein LOC133868322 [Alnus glutinosa]|uniref:uncharacterized protein LOC133868322 n=1 Tax=Alnus glutinosa TaxID=3517 RepID=UPI002D7A3B2D|nr:uncharacterized protein LOC133868322 [Alnus glutinosa]